MARRPAPLTGVLLAALNCFCLQGDSSTDVPGLDHDLHCVNDYINVINCSLSIATARNSSDVPRPNWLFFHIFDNSQFWCLLKNTDQGYFCSAIARDLNNVALPCLMDTDVFQISLCQSRNDSDGSCKLLDDNYTPYTNIKPNPPGSLDIRRSSGKHHFTWISSYQTELKDSLRYQLQCYKRQDKNNVLGHDIYYKNLTYSVDDNEFVPDTEYSARIRSIPGSFYHGSQWSDWSSEVHWRTEKAPRSSRGVLWNMMLLISLAVVLLITLAVCAFLRKWRQSTLIPSPAPYFHPLYSKYHGDFKSWVESGIRNPLHTEETFPIDSLTKHAGVQEDGCPQAGLRRPLESSYCNMGNPVSDLTLLGIPYAVTTMAPLSDTGSSWSLSFRPGSPVRDDSGCWLSTNSSLRTNAPWYCNEYCTLKVFQKPSSVTESPAQTGI